MPPGWSLLGAASFVPTTGVETVNGTGDLFGAVTYNVDITNPNMVIEASTFYSGYADNQNIGFYS